MSFEGTKIHLCTDVEIGGSSLVGKYQEHVSIALFFLFIFCQLWASPILTRILSHLVSTAHCPFCKWVEKPLGGFLILNNLTLHNKVKCHYNPSWALAFLQIHFLFFSSESVATLSIWKLCAKYITGKIEKLSQKGSLESYFQGSHYWQIPNWSSYYCVFLKTHCVYNLQDPFSVYIACLSCIFL